MKAGVEDRHYNALQSLLRVLRLIQNDTGVVPYIPCESITFFAIYGCGE